MKEKEKEKGKERGKGDNLPKGSIIPRLTLTNENLMLLLFYINVCLFTILF